MHSQGFQIGEQQELVEPKEAELCAKVGFLFGWYYETPDMILVGSILHGYSLVVHNCERARLRDHTGGIPGANCGDGKKLRALIGADSIRQIAVQDIVDAECQNIPIKPTSMSRFSIEFHGIKTPHNRISFSICPAKCEI